MAYNLIIRQLGGIGDFLMLSTVFRGMKEKYPKDKLHLVTGREFMNGVLFDLVEHMGFVDKVHDVHPKEWTTYRTRERDPLSMPEAKDIMTLDCVTKAKRVIDLNNACMDYEMAAMFNGGIKKSRTQVWCEAAGVEPSSRLPLYRTTAAEKAWAKEEFEARGWGLDGRPVVGVALTSKDRSRSVSDRKYLDVLNSLALRGMRPVIVGSAFRTQGCDYLVTDVVESFALIERMDLMVAVDSGLLHAAGTLGVPLVALFGPTDPDMRMGPYYGSAFDVNRLVSCAHCWYKRSCTAPGTPMDQVYACMNKLPVDVIAEEAVRLLGR